MKRSAVKRPRRLSRWRLAACAWGVVVLLSVVALLQRLSTGAAFETRLLALLPESVENPLIDRALERVSEAGSKQVVILVGHSELQTASRAADALGAHLEGHAGIGRVVTKQSGDLGNAAQDFYFPYRYGLLTPGQRERLRQEPEEGLVQQAVERIYNPVGPPRLTALDEDPFGLFSEALLETASDSPFRPEGDRLVVREGRTRWVVVFVELSESGASLAEQSALLDLFQTATRAAQEAGAREVLHAGFIFHAAAAARQAQHEMSTIGLGSLLGIMALMLLTFRSPKPLLLAALPIAVGCVVALGLGQLIFPRLHLLTLVFGSSIIGVAVDYGFLFVAGRASERPWDAQRRRVEILPSVAMAVGTSLLAYAVLASLPFPILRQMGVFAMLGLAAAWLTALLWLPAAGATLPQMSARLLPALLLWAKQHWPRVGESRLLTFALAAAAVLCGVSMTRLKSNNDIRSFYASSPDAVRQGQRVEQLLRLPSTGQFFLVSAPTEEELLQRDEQLSGRLLQARRDGWISDFQAMSRFVPSQKRQKENWQLEWERLYKPGTAASRVFKALDASETGEIAQRKMQSGTLPLLPGAWLQSPLSGPFRSLWLGQGSQGFSELITLSGLQGDSMMHALEQVAKASPGVVWVDHVGALSALMSRFQTRLTRLMVLGYAVVALLLFARYRGSSWRALAPALLGCIFTAGLFGALKVECNLFCIFGFLLSLDMGVDYGIYLQETGAGDFRVSFLGASLSAVATLLSFGLLALSQTPALRTFGLTVLFSIGAAWLLAPCFSKRTV